MSSHADFHHDHKPTGIKRWLFSTNHKDIGTMYLFFALIMAIIATLMSVVIRIELYEPGFVFIQPEFYNQMITMHGILMIFGVAMPAATGLANWMIPPMIGAPDMALPRLNNWSFWLLPFAFTLSLSTFFGKSGAPDFGWTFYAPLSTTYAPKGTDFFIFSVHMMGISSILASLNVVVTVINMRCPGMTWMKLPIFVWSWFITAFLLLAVMPVLAGCVTMMLLDRNFHKAFFEAAGGGDPVLFQHMFWFFGHPEVYVLVLPAFGVISQVIPTFSRKKLFGYNVMVYATVAIAGLGFLVWMHHMFTTGAGLSAQLFFMYTTMVIAIPTGVKVFNWLATMHRGSLTFETPMLFAMGFLVVFTVGGVTGIMCALVPADYQYRGSYFVVAHFHYPILAIILAFFAAVYFWMPKWFGKMYSEPLGKCHFWLTIVFTNLTFFPMHFVGLAGMPRRIPDYPLQFTDMNQFISISAFILVASQFLFIYNVFRSVRHGRDAPMKPWDGAEGLVWTLPSPMPYHSFETPPTVE